MVSRIQQLGTRILPRGWGDWLRQIVLFCGAYYVYRIVRGMVDDRVATAFANAREIVSIERGLHLFVEPDIQRFARAHEWLIDVSSWMYVNSHFVVTTVALAWIYLRRNERFYFVRNMFMVAMGLALVLYVLFPTAPPRLLPDLGFVDLANRYGESIYGPYADGLSGQLMAMPSLHVGWAALVAWTVWRQAVGRGRWLGIGHLVVMTVVVVASANHWWMDGLVAVALLVLVVAAVERMPRIVRLAAPLEPASA